VVKSLALQDNKRSLSGILMTRHMIVLIMLIMLLLMMMILMILMMMKL
jgi:hypothetical protein